MNAPETAAPTTLLRFRDRREVAAGTMAFHFDKPAGFGFKPGQAIELLLSNPDNGSDSMGHAFSLVSAPFEDELVIATRMRDSQYKRVLASLAPGASVRMEGPFGSLTLHKDTRRAAVFIAGGIGITPFMSMLRQAACDGFARDVALLYSNRRPGDAAYLDELRALQAKHPRFRLVATMTEAQASAPGWNGETRPIDASLIRAAADGLPSPIFYVAGPPGMVEAMRGALTAAGADDDDIRSEDFYGY